MIAGCAGFFSVIGIGDLFEGNAPWIKSAVIVMAASLEVGKLVAASFLYRYWKKSSVGLRAYLFAAVLVLMGITSFGIYGFLSKAFRDNDLKVDTLRNALAVPEGEIALLDQQATIFRNDIAGQQQKVTGHEKKIATHQGNISSFESKVAEKEQRIQVLEEQVEVLRKQTPSAVPANEKQIADERTRLLGLISQIRSQIDDRENSKLQHIQASNKEIANYQKQTLLANERLVALDKTVQILTDKGPGGILKNNYVKKGEELRLQQKPERDAMRGHIAKINENIKISRDRLQENLSRVDVRINDLENEIVQYNTAIGELANKAKTLDIEAKDQHKSKIDFVLGEITGVENEIRGLKGEIQTQYAEIRKEEDLILKAEYVMQDATTGILKTETGKRKPKGDIQVIFSEIDQTEIGAFKFIARAFFEDSIEAAQVAGGNTALWEAEKKAMDSVVKWFILVIVLVFDPLAVTLVVAFNVALLKDGVEKKEFWKFVIRPVMAIFTIGLILFGFIYVRNSGLPADGSSEDRMMVADEISDPDSSPTALDKFRQALFPAQKKASNPSSNTLVTAPLLRRIPGDAVFVMTFRSFDKVLDSVEFVDLLSHGLSSSIAPNLSRELKEICANPAGYGVAREQPAYFFSKFPPGDTPKGPGSLATYPASGILFSIERPGALEVQLADTLLGTIGGRWRVEIESGFKAFYHRDRRLAVAFDESALAIFEDPLGQLGDAGLRDEINNLFTGKSSSMATSKTFVQHAQDRYHLGLWFDGTAFFREMNRDAAGSPLYGRLRKFLDFQSTYQITFDKGVAMFDGKYFYRENRLSDSGILSLRSALQDIRPGDASTAQDQLMLLCVEKLDYTSFCQILEKPEPAQNKFVKLLGAKDAMDGIVFSRNIETPTEGRFSLTMELKEKNRSSLSAISELIKKSINTEVTSVDSQGSN
ncbi:MAG: hypothetical protein HOL08_04285 [Opitutae bacterium]|nr:hypothetical protein [Opitutae bacterium]